MCQHATTPGDVDVCVRTYSLLELSDGHSDQFWLSVTLQLEEARFILDDLS